MKNASDFLLFACEIRRHHAHDYLKKPSVTCADCRCSTGARVWSYSNLVNRGEFCLCWILLFQMPCFSIFCSDRLDLARSAVFVDVFPRDGIIYPIFVFNYYNDMRVLRKIIDTCDVLDFFLRKETDVAWGAGGPAVRWIPPHRWSHARGTGTPRPIGSGERYCHLITLLLITPPLTQLLEIQ